MIHIHIHILHHRQNPTRVLSLKLIHFLGLLLVVVESIMVVNILTQI